MSCKFSSSVPFLSLRRGIPPFERRGKKEMKKALIAVIGTALLAVSGADIVLLAVPVAATEATLKAIKHLLTKDMLIMDVGSTQRASVWRGRLILWRWLKICSCR